MSKVVHFGESVGVSTLKEENCLCHQPLSIKEYEEEGNFFFKISSENYAKFALQFF